MPRPRGYRASWFVLHAFALGALGCAEILGVNEGKPRPAGTGGEGGGGGDPGGSGAGAAGGGAGAAGGGAGSEGGGGAAPDRLTAPLVLFTDLESGPPGAYVTLYGVRLVEGDSDAIEVTFGGAPASLFSKRDGAYAADDVARALDVIVVQVDEDMPFGSMDVVVRRNGVASDTVRFTVRPGTIRFVDEADGNDESQDCTEAAPCASLAKLASVLAPGDVAYVRDGDYSGDTTCDTTHDDLPITCALPLAQLARPGTADRPIAVVGYPGERPHVGLLGAPRDADMLYVGVRAARAGYVVLSNLVFTDVGMGGSIANMDGLRIVGCRFESYAADGVYLHERVDAVTILGSTFATGARTALRGVGACNVEVVNVEVGFSEFDHVPDPITFEPKEVSEIRFHHNLANTLHSGLNMQYCNDTTAGQSSGRVAYFDNVIKDAEQVVLLPKETTAGAEILVFNNTFYHLSACGFRLDGPETIPFLSGEAIHIRNNVIALLGTPYFCFLDPNAGTPPEDVSLMGDRNLFWGGAGVFPGALGIRADPLLVNPPSDVSLSADSPAVDAGAEVLVDVAMPLPRSARFDYGGLPRMIGDAVDIGAHERLPD
ncbi:choice-of-anchor Q domain-containing protein [Sorangium sp. So ce131]|uniref:choice-of-anchor Q domain-containing protein n=1 Tax=Sorangium sp. So ce131 TaxID=3133282 RepID=UPI003F620CC7